VKRNNFYYFFVKKIYFLLFRILKFFKYPSAIIESNFIMPNVKIGKNVIIKENCRIQSHVYIGDFTFINHSTQIDPFVKIGKYCSISHGVKIGLGPHPMNFFSTSTVFYKPYRGFVNEELYNEFKEKGYTEIGNDVLIGANALILAGIKIGDGAIIGAGSVITKDVPPYAVVVGNPGKIIKYRFDEATINKLLKIKWWDRDLKEILKYKEDFNNINKFIKHLTF